MSDLHRSIQTSNNMAASEVYRQTDFGIRPTNEETANVISSTFGVIKNSLDMLWYSVGLDPNVNTAYERAMMDPDAAIESNGKKFYMHPGVGNLRPYNEAGNPAGGCFSMQTLA